MIIIQSSSLSELFRLKQESPVLFTVVVHMLHHKVTSSLSPLLFFSLQGRHVKTGQLAAIKVMDVTEVSKQS